MEIIEFNCTFDLIPRQDNPAYAVCVHQIQKDDRSMGKMLYRRNLETLSQCREQNIWPAYADEIVQITLPAWARKEIWL